jgi:hypothetical protein
MIDWLLFGAVWTLVLYSIGRGYRRHGADYFARLVWSTSIGVGLVCTFRVPAIMAWIDALFGGHPVASLLGALSTIVTAVLYTRILLYLQAQAHPPTTLQRFHRWFLYAAPLFCLVLVLLVVSSGWAWLTDTQIYYSIRFVLGLYMLPLATLLLIPANLEFFRRERVFPMQCKHLTMIIGMSVYSIGTAIALGRIGVFYMTGQMPHEVERNGYAVLGGLCIVAMLVPHRWLVATQLLSGWYRYLKLAALERQIATLVDMQRTPLEWRHVFQQPHVDTTSYTIVINILDDYPDLENHETGQALFLQIEAAQERYSAPDELANALSRIKMMSDPIPDTQNQLANAISWITHPLLIFIPALLVVLKGAEPGETLAWIGLIAAVIFGPAAVLSRYFRRQGRYTYQRDTRHLIYLTFWLSMLFCTGLAIVLDAPSRLLFALIALCIWVPLQSAVNARWTKISIHLAVVTGIMASLLMLLGRRQFWGVKFEKRLIVWSC